MDGSLGEYQASLVEAYVALLDGDQYKLPFHIAHGVEDRESAAVSKPLGLVAADDGAVV